MEGEQRQGGEEHWEKWGQRKGRIAVEVYSHEAIGD